jgi:hypothetical protein
MRCFSVAFAGILCFSCQALLSLGTHMRDTAGLLKVRFSTRKADSYKLIAVSFACKLCTRPIE